MKTIPTTALLALLTTLTQALPFPYSSPRQYQAPFKALIIFEGAANAAFTLSVPTDGSYFIIENLLSVSHITSPGGAVCAFYGIDGSFTFLVGADTVDVGPPQTQVSGSCQAL